ncbi:MAG: carbonic anhydrase [Bacteroidota bacterium]
MSFTSQIALRLLKEGNFRFLTGNPVHPAPEAPSGPLYRMGQNPFAVVVTCADSRLSPEIIFDMDHGHLFVVKTAGNIASRFDIGSVEYAVRYLGVKLVVVMGHEACGAVDASILKCIPDSSPLVKDPAAEYVVAIRKRIRRNLNLPEDKPCECDEAKPSCPDNPGRDMDLTEAINQNASAVRTNLTEKSALLADAVKNHGVQILSAYYAFNGEVIFHEDLKAEES